MLRSVVIITATGASVYAYITLRNPHDHTRDANAVGGAFRANKGITVPGRFATWTGGFHSLVSDHWETSFL